MARSKIRPITTCARDNGKWAHLRLNFCLTRLEGAAPPKLVNARAVSQFLHDVFPMLGSQATESIWVIPIITGNEPVGVAEVGKGGADQVAIGPAELLRPVLMSPARSFIIAHNHPSGRLEFSPQDVDLTRRAAKAAQACGCRLLDHLLVTADPALYLSMQETRPEVLNTDSFEG